MLLIASNTGNWDHDMWGAVGAIDVGNASTTSFENVYEEVMEFIADEKDDDENFSDTDVTYLVGTDACKDVMEENEVSCLCNGTPVACAIYEEDGYFADIYFVFDLESK